MRREHCHHRHKQPDTRMEQHMTTTDHPLTETAAAELWDAHREPGVLPLHAQGRLYVRDQTAMLRAAYDAGARENVSVEIIPDISGFKRATDPHHDPRPWQDCTRKDICKDDLVETRGFDRLRISVAHHQDEYGDWRTEDGWRITDDDHWPLRRIPAPTPEKETAMTETTPAALPHLTADDLRHTPAGRALMAEAWVVGKFDGAKVCEADHFHHPAKPCTPNPYKETP